MTEWTDLLLSRRACLPLLVGLIGSTPAQAQGTKAAFDQWVASFRARARARGISDATYTPVMGGIKPDTSVYALDRAQPEF